MNWWLGLWARAAWGICSSAYHYLSEAARVSAECCNFLDAMVMQDEFGITNWMVGKLARAVELFREALRLGVESGVAQPWLPVADQSSYDAVLLEQNDVEQALQHARTSVEYASWWPSANHAATAFTYLGCALQAAGDLDEAAAAFERAGQEQRRGPVLEGVRAEAGGQAGAPVAGPGRPGHGSCAGQKPSASHWGPALIRTRCPPTPRKCAWRPWRGCAWPSISVTSDRCRISPPWPRPCSCWTAWR